jgi:glutamate-ammonia-ligase adenylyltransferase
MALTRARPVFGSPPAREELAAAVAHELGQARDPDKLRADILAMRREMARHKPAKGPLDVKLLRGGLVDLEFVVHFLQLRDRVGLDPALGTALEALSGAGLVAADLLPAYRLLARCLIATRLLAAGADIPGAAAQAVLAKACGCRDWQDLLAGLDGARQTVRTAWRAAFGEAMEEE